MSSLSTTRLCLKGVSRDISEEALKRFVGCYGRVLEVKYVYNNSFIEFVCEKDARFFYDTFKDKPFLGSKDVIIEFAHLPRKHILRATDSKKSDRELDHEHSSTPVDSLKDDESHGGQSEYVNVKTDNHKRYRIDVKNLARTVAWQELKDFARLAGRQVAYCHVNSNNRDGFIEYDTKEDADHAVQKLTGRRLEGKEVHLSPAVSSITYYHKH